MGFDLLYNKVPCQMQYSLRLSLQVNLGLIWARNIRLRRLQWLVDYTAE